MRPKHNPNTIAEEIATSLEHAQKWHVDDNTGYLLIPLSRLTAKDLHYLSDLIYPVTVYPYNTSTIDLTVNLKHDAHRTLSGHAHRSQSGTAPTNSTPPSDCTHYIHLESELLYRHDIRTLAQYGAAEVWPGNQLYLSIRLYTTIKKI